MNELRLKEYRKVSKMSQRDVAKLLNTPQSNYWKWENGISYPDAKQIMQLCNIFKCTPNDLFGIRGVVKITQSKMRGD